MIREQLLRLERTGQRLRVGVVGVGYMGTSTGVQVHRCPGMETAALCDLSLENCYRAYGSCGVSREEVVVASTVAQANRAIRNGKPVATTQWEVLCGADVDVVVEATGLPGVCARVTMGAIQAKKHIVLLTVEMDVLVGSLCAQKAREAGVVYTVATGDEPGALMELYDFAIACGFDVVAAGKSPFKPINRYVTPDDVVSEASEFRLNPKMLCSFRDGSKTDVEMTCVANATGMPPDVRGMHGPTVALPDLAKVFSLKAQGGILDRSGVVEFATSILSEDGKALPGVTVAPGVFVVFASDNDKVRADLRWLMMGDGPTYVLCRPYHLVALEMPIAIAHAVIRHEAWLAPLARPVADVTTVAKRDLKAGEMLDGCGGYTVHGMIDLAEVSLQEGYLPLGLAENIRATHDLKRGDPLTYDSVELDESSLLVSLRREQDALMTAGGQMA